MKNPLVWTQPLRHNYRCRLTFREEQFHGKEPLVRYDSIETCIRGLRTELDHHYLNEEVVGLKERPITTESLAGYIYERANTMIPLHRVRLHEREDFFAEACRNNTTFLGLQVPFHAAHRLHTAALSESENANLYGKCNNPRGHGHRYLTETTIGGEYNARSGTLYDFAAFQKAIEESLEPWRIDIWIWKRKIFETPFNRRKHRPHTLPKIDNRLNQQLVRLRLWETANNQFTLRRFSTW
jgi:6-pyruvoyltetrahydropterin/6-carboxytetrahydropterin synthase